jgi:hypothetical protein
MKLHVVLAVTCMIVSAVALSQELRYGVSTEAGAVVRIVEVQLGQEMGSLRQISVTYEAVKKCPFLGVIGHSYSSSNIQLAPVAFATRQDVVPGQQFRDQVFVANELGAYFMIDKVYCM